MNQTIIPTQRETVLEENELIISKTDPKGRLIYVNRTFMKVCKMSEIELLGRQHNVIRHPDMPRGVFQKLWDTLRAGEEYFAYIKNICGDGGYYWVLANITPDYDVEGNLLGYYSVRRKPSRASIDTVLPIYQEMLKIEAQHTKSRVAIQSSLDYLQSVLREKNQTYNQFIFSLLKQDGYL